jgi:hypothetical protein
MGQVLENATPALAGHGVCENERTDFVFDIRVENGLVVPAFLNGVLELATEILVKAVMAAVLPAAW